MMASIAPPAHSRNQRTTDEWITPKWLVHRLGRFGLDPCAAVDQPWACADRQYTEGGLHKPWWGHVYVNPPYGRQLGVWLERLAKHGDGVALVFARTDTKAFADWVWPFATSLLFLRGRLSFCRTDGTPAKHKSGGPSVLIAYGEQADHKLSQMTDLGAYMVNGSGK